MAKSWSHHLARALIRPLAVTAVTPNHLTTLRALSGAAACLGFAWGDQRAAIWGGVAWILSALLDRADGELARLTGQTSAAGQRYDFVADTTVNAAMFVAVGVGLRHGVLGPWSVALGLLCGACLALCLYWSEEIETRLLPGSVVLGGIGGFDPDDLFYLIAAFAWAGVLSFVLMSGSVVLVAATLFIGIDFARVRRRAADAPDRRR